MAALKLIACLALLLLATEGSATDGGDPYGRVEALFAEWDRTDRPGCEVSVIQDGKPVLERSYGMANLEYGVPISKETAFYIASTSKQFTAISALLAARQGKFSLDDDVRVHVPELPDYGHTITIRHLIHHTSGIRDYLAVRVLGGHSERESLSAEEVLDLLARQRNLTFAPGSDFGYSNSGYFLLGKIIERTTGRTLREFADENIFSPLGMLHTHFQDDVGEIVSNVAQGYEVLRDGAVKKFVGNSELVGAGGIVTTMGDLELWDRNFYSNRLESGSADLLEVIQTKGVLNNGDPVDYAYGLGIREYRGFRTVAHPGSFLGFKSDLLRFPEEKLSVMLLCNVQNVIPGELVRKIADAYLPKQPSEAAGDAEDRTAAFPQPTPDALAEMAGVYETDDGKSFVAIIERGKDVMLTGSGYRAVLVPTSESTFEFGASKDGKLDWRGGMLILSSADTTPATFRKTSDNAKDVATRLPSAQGKWYSDELDVRLDVSETKSGLSARPGFGRVITFSAIDGRHFATEGGVLIVLDDKGGDNRLLLDAGSGYFFAFRRLQAAP